MLPTELAAGRWPPATMPMKLAPTASWSFQGRLHRLQRITMSEGTGPRSEERHCADANGDHCFGYDEEPQSRQKRCAKRITSIGSVAVVMTRSQISCSSVRTTIGRFPAAMRSLISACGVVAGPGGSTPRIPCSGGVFFRSPLRQQRHALCFHDITSPADRGRQCLHSLLKFTRLQNFPSLGISSIFLVKLNRFNLSQHCW